MIRPAGFLAIVLAACTIDSAKRADSAAGPTAAVTTTPPRVAPDSAIGDTIVGLAVSDTMPSPSITPTAPSMTMAAPSLPTPTVPSAVGSATKAMADTGLGVATVIELQQLRAVLDVPVQGVPRSALRDNFTEARAGHAHEALDIMAPLGTPVLSATDGKVTKLHESKDGGHMIYAADATDRFILMYAHLDRYADGVVASMPVRRGQLIGYVGKSGNAATPHLHFALARGKPSVKWWKGTAVNPYPLLAPDAVGR